MLSFISTRIPTHRATQGIIRNLYKTRPSPRLKPRMDSFFKSHPVYIHDPPGLGTSIFRRAFSQSNFGPPPSYHSARAAVRTIIALNTVVFGTTYYAINTQNVKLKKWLDENFMLNQANFSQGRHWTPLTSAFQHANLMHFAFNMIAFNAFAGIMSVVPGVGALHIFGLCFGSAIAGAGAFLYEHASETAAPRNGFSSNIYRSQHVSSMHSACGASGVVMGFGMAATCLFPKAPMSLLFPPVTLPLWALMGLYVGLDWYLLGSSSSRIGHSAHLGGAVFGALYYFSYLRNLGGVWMTVRRMIRR